MCLSIKEESKIQIARKDIVVYKHLKIKVLHNGEIIYKTSYRYVVVEIGQSCYSELERTYYQSIEIGLHSFSNKRDCIIDGKNERANVVVKCIIPKGSRYYKGSFNISYDKESVSYASDKLTYVEIIKTLK